MQQIFVYDTLGVLTTLGYKHSAGASTNTTLSYGT
jgi:hypothetical protein